MYLKHVEIVTDQDKLKVDLQSTLMKYTTIKQWAYILHDKDDTRPHYHIYLNFGTASVSTAEVAKWFDIGENFISKVKGRKADVLLYLTHGNDSQKNKHQYDPTEVVANFDFKTEIENSKILGDFEKYSYAQQLQYVNSLPLSEKSRAYSQLKKLWDLYCQCSTLKADRKIDVMFICGKGGVGKTYYAKKLLTSLNFDFCVSSSSNDPFQDYLGQQAIILDDLRDRCFELEDLLKILDNNTASSVRSRFNNRIFYGKMIVITSSVPLRYWYSLYRLNDNDALVQLYRRISCYVVVTHNDVTVYDTIDDKGMPAGKGMMYKNELANAVSMKQQKTDFNSMFSQICERSICDVFDGEQIKLTV